MKQQKIRKRINLITFMVESMMVIMLLLTASITSNAQDYKEDVPGKYYEFEKDSKYEISTSYSKNVISYGSSYGLFSIEGNVKPISDINGIAAYEVAESNVNFSYNLKNAYATAASSTWHLIEDKSKTVDDLKLDSDILSGAVILQTSLTGKDWITDIVYTDIRGENSTYKEALYTSKNIQQVNGCYYRIIVVYELNKENEVDKGITNWAGVEQEYKKCAEVYEFYLIDSSENAPEVTLPTDTPRKELGTKINTGKDNGYSGNETIDNKDPHFGWDIGTFFVNGYTRETVDTEGNPVFLKNVGDRVTLWFNLKEDINCLDGNSKWTINEDINGYDQYFEIEKTNFKHGTLIICYIDHEGNKHDPVIYTDYLAANTRTGADTKVELFEEGDYEVALNYEIKDSSGMNVCTNYRIYFEFSIRNGNCIVFPFDIATGAELSDNVITENGFRLDMAKSRYLTIDVKKEVIKSNDMGYITDERFNRPAQDGEMYSEEGIYTFTVKNLYTDESTEKVVYVGKTPVLKALASGYSLEEINNLLAQGAEIQADGSLVKPVVNNNDEVVEFDKQLSSEDVLDTKTNIDLTDEENAANKPVNSSTVAEESKGRVLPFIVLGAVGIVTVAGLVFFVKKQQSMKTKIIEIEEADE